MDKYKFGVIDVMFSAVENLCEIIEAYDGYFDRLAMVVDIDTIRKDLVFKPYIQGEDVSPQGGANIGAFGSDIYKSEVPEAVLLVYFYEATMMLVKEKEKDVASNR